MSEEFSAVLTPGQNEFARTSFKRAMDHAAAMLDSGDDVLVSVGPALEPISIKQRKFLHGAVLKQISEQACVGPKRERYTTEVWKRYFVQRLLPPQFELRRDPRWDAELCRLVQPKRATPRRRETHTEELGIRAYAKFTNEVIDHAVAELEVEFVFTTEERELLARKPAKRDPA